MLFVTLLPLSILSHFSLSRGKQPLASLFHHVLVPFVAVVAAAAAAKAAFLLIGIGCLMALWIQKQMANTIKTCRYFRMSFIVLFISRTTDKIRFDHATVPVIFAGVME